MKKYINRHLSKLTRTDIQKNKSTSIPNDAGLNAASMSNNVHAFQYRLEIANTGGWYLQNHCNFVAKEVITLQKGPQKDCSSAVLVTFSHRANNRMTTHQALEIPWH